MVRALKSSDAGILKLYKKNKHQALEMLYERYKKYVYTIAYHYTGNQEDALDLTQEVFISIFKSLNQNMESGSTIEDFLAAPDHTDDFTCYRDTKDSLENAIKMLPPRERMAVILRHMKGMHYEEIAKVMELPLGTVKTLLHRGRKCIKASMIKDGILEV